MERRVRNPLLAALACAAALAPLAVAAYGFEPVESLDLRILVNLQREGGVLFQAASALVNLGGAVALIALVAAVCGIGLHFGRRLEVVAALVLVAGANVTTQLLKVVLRHVRHQAFEHGIELPWPNSFPSGHTTAAASIAIALLFVVPARLRPVAALAGAGLTGAVGFSTVVLAWHYPSDVLGGLLVAAIWGFAALAFVRFRAAREGAHEASERPRSRNLAVSTD